VATVDFHHVFKRFGDIEAVRDLDLAIQESELLVLVGPSGSGKSTALRMLAGLETVTDGEIAIDGVSVNRVVPRDRDIAMVFQDYALYPQMTVAANLSFGLRRRGVSREEIRLRVGEVADALELGELLDRRPAQLSGGQAQRVALGRAVVREPKVFLMDEPLSNLDARLRTQTRGEIRRLQQRLRTTTLYVTHDQVEAMTMGDRIAVMKDGVLVQVGTPKEVYDQPATRFVGEFIGSPGMAIFEAATEPRPGGIHLTAPGVSALLELPLDLPASVAVGARPEAAALWGADGLAGPLRGRVAFVEALGRETLVGVECDGTTLTLRDDGRCDVLPGDHVTFGLEAGALRFFDVQSGVLLHPHRSTPSEEAGR
jgi:ABC-type sugar transport system ATPase subunit